MFEIVTKDKNSKARKGILTTPHGKIETPVFMPVGTLAAVKTLSPKELDECHTQIILANAYHLYLRPGLKAIKKLGGLHKFMGWKRAILTDSGGYQIFSLATLRKVNDEGAEFQSHIDGSRHFLNPEKVMEIQFALGSDIIVPLDECLPYPVGKSKAKRSLERTTTWAKRSKDYLIRLNKTKEKKHQLLFGIVQGSTYPDLRKEAVRELADIDFDGYCLGGLSVGEPLKLAYKMIEISTDCLEEDKPRYLMGVGTPIDLIESVERGIDMFDCVLPTRVGRNGTAFTELGRVNLKNAKFASNNKPIEPDCNCYTCKHFSRSYLRHLLLAKEMLGLRLVSLHNTYFYANLMKKIGEAIVKKKFNRFKKEFLKKYKFTKNEVSRLHKGRLNND